jgi:hypothetical protein
MTTVTQQFNEINKQQNTLNMIVQFIAQINPNTLYVTNTETNYDTVRIGAIRSFLTVEKAAVESDLADLLNCNVSGC